MSKHFRSFLTLFSFSMAEKRPKEKAYLWCLLLLIIIIIYIFCLKSTSGAFTQSNSQEFEVFCCLYCNHNAYTTPRRESGIATSVIHCFRTLYFITTLWTNRLLQYHVLLCCVRSSLCEIIKAQKDVFFKDGAYYCYCAYILHISRYSDFLSPMLTNTGIFLHGLKLPGESRS